MKPSKWATPSLIISCTMLQLTGPHKTVTGQFSLWLFGSFIVHIFTSKPDIVTANSSIICKTHHGLSLEEGIRNRSDQLVYLSHSLRKLLQFWGSTRGNILHLKYNHKNCTLFRVSWKTCNKCKTCGSWCSSIISHSRILMVKLTID